MARSFRFGLRIADFILSRTSSLSAAKPSHFFTECHSIKAIGCSGRFIKGNGRFIKAGQPQRLILLAKLTFRRGGPRNQPGVGFRVFTFTGIGSTAAG